VVSSFRGVVGHSADNKLTCEMELGFEQTTQVWGVCESALKPHQTGKAQGRQAKTPNRTWENWLSGSVSRKGWSVQWETDPPRQKSGAS